ncbi:MAG TPA: glycoside hydrolase family 3 C-terminal domain-containing protein [Steroidobacteraceae bacterium]
MGYKTRWGIIASFAFSLLLAAGRMWAAAAICSIEVAAHEHDPRASAIARVEALLQQMTLEEKISLIQGAEEKPSTNQGEAGFLPGVERLGIPSMRLADGPPGILTRVASAAPTSTMGLAATFSKVDAERTGRVIGLEAKRLGVDIALEPFINILRDLSFRRGWNTFGEDPVLTGELGASEIHGIQAEGVMAQAKHFAGYDLNGYDATVAPQTLHEVYLAPFADAVAAGVSSIMCSYNKLNGEFACGNGLLLNEILRDEMGFTGFETADWGAVHQSRYINAGLDMEMPGKLLPASPWLSIMRSYFDISPGQMEPLQTSMSVLGRVFARSMPEEVSLGPPKARPKNMEGQFPDDPHPQNMWEALRTGQVKMTAIDGAVTHVLLQMERFGYLDGKTHQPTGAPPDTSIINIIKKTSEDSAVLLKNDGGILPLNHDSLQSVALIGPGAAQTVALGINAEHALGLPERQVGSLKQFEELAAHDPRVHLTFSVADDMTGTPIPAAALSHQGMPGLLRTEGTTALTADGQVDFTRSNNRELAPDSHYSWKGELTVPRTCSYWIYLQMLGTNANLSIDGKEISRTSSVTGARHGDTVQAGQDNLLPTFDGLNNVRRAVQLDSGVHSIAVATESDTSHAPVQIRLNWMTPERRDVNFKLAVAAAKRAKTAVVFAWQKDVPTFGLPGDQDALIDAISAVNSHTIVILNTSLPIAMPWLHKVKAVLEMWWTGDEGGLAAANVLLGQVSPAGRLPFTWAQRLEDYPATDPAYPERGQRLDGKVTYSEGIDVGYRWFDQHGIKPLFPFGYGLSYTKFRYSDLKVKPAAAGGLDASFTLQNVGQVASDEVPQVYLGAPADIPDGVKFAPRTLIGFDRITLKPGESKRVSIPVQLRRLQYWSEIGKKWITKREGRTLYIGDSSRDFKLHQPLD